MASLPQRIAGCRGRRPRARVDSGKMRLARLAGMQALGIAAMVLAMLTIAAPSRASDSCMTRDEARQRFSTSRLYWHGADHCWDATSPRGLRRAARNKQTAKQAPPVPQTAPDPDPAQSLGAPGPEDSVPSAPTADAASGAISAAAPPDPQPETIAPAPPARDPHRGEQTAWSRGGVRDLFSGLAVVTVAAMLGFAELKRRRSDASYILRFTALRRTPPWQDAAHPKPRPAAQGRAAFWKLPMAPAARYHWLRRLADAREKVEYRLQRLVAKGAGGDGRIGRSASDRAGAFAPIAAIRAKAGSALRRVRVRAAGRAHGRADRQRR